MTTKKIEPKDKEEKLESKNNKEKPKPKNKEEKFDSEGKKEKSKSQNREEKFDSEGKKEKSKSQNKEKKFDSEGKKEKSKSQNNEKKPNFGDIKNSEDKERNKNPEKIKKSEEKEKNIKPEDTKESKDKKKPKKIDILSQELDLKPSQIKAVIDLTNQGNTVPFIERYKKENTGSLDDKTIRLILERFKYLKKLEKRKEDLINYIKERDPNELSDNLKKSINEAKGLNRLKYIYNSYKLKKYKNSQIAKDKGLNPLANIIRFQRTEIPIETIAKDFISKENGVKTVEEAISGAQDIIAEIISNNDIYIDLIRKITYEEGELVVEAKDKDLSSPYEMYYEHKEPLIDIPNYRILAINRGEKEGFLKVKFIAPDDEIIDYLKRHILIDNSENFTQEYNEITKELMEESISRSYKQLIAPLIENEIRDFLTERAENKSIEIFSNNLENLLMRGPIRNKVVLGLNPLLYGASKVAVVDETGDILETDIIHSIGIENKFNEIKKQFLDIINKHNVDIIALGDSQETKELEQIIAQVIKGTNVKYALINSAGASDYWGSIFGAMELPDLEKGHRMAFSIARRLQDPLVEFVKVDPKYVGVGQYQHDMDQKKLNSSLNDVIEKVVNEVGVDLNSASLLLLLHVAGLDSAIANNIIQYREKNSVFTNREELLKIEGIDSDIFRQSAGFLKVFTSGNPLDCTNIHPDQYEITEKLFKNLNYDLKDLLSGNLSFDNINIESLSKELNIEKSTLEFIIEQVKNPLRDPRDGNSQTMLRSDVLTIEDLKENMILEGFVRNVVEFGAFVDIGVHYDGLIHISKMNKGKFVNHPLEIVNVGDIVKVKILEVDIEQKKIQLYMLD